MSVEENKALIARIIEEFINKNNPAVADEIFADDFLNHNPQYGVTPDREGLKQMIALLHTGFPDFHADIEDMIAEKDKVVVCLRTTGTFSGEFLGFQPTNKSFRIFQISVLRFDGQKVKERWNVNDQLDSMRQLGLM